MESKKTTLRAQWRAELHTLADEKKVTPRQLCLYLGTRPVDRPGFWTKMPAQRNIFIGIGMALKQPLETINRWIVYYGGKHRLYSKDITEDLAWIYLINACCRDKNSDINYYSRHAQCCFAIRTIYEKMWRGELLGFDETQDLDAATQSIEYDDEYIELIRFVEDNIAALNGAYNKPRRMLTAYTERLLEALNLNGDRIWTLNKLRGYLDDSMINYLSGASDRINVINRKSRKITAEIKHVPRKRSYHIRMCISLGMTTQDVNKYLVLMGYSQLCGDDEDEARLIRCLDEWEQMHILQRLFKSRYIYGMETDIDLGTAMTYQAAVEMLSLRAHLELSNAGL